MQKHRIGVAKRMTNKELQKTANEVRKSIVTAVHAAGAGHEVHLYEKNEKLGKKLFITGKGRCNVTNDSDEQQFLQSMVSNPRFLYSAIYGWNSSDVIRFFEEAGVKLKTERGNRVFPQSDHSSDIIRALERQLEKNDVQIHLNCPVQGIRIQEEKVSGIILKNGKEVSSDAVVVRREACPIH